MPNGIPDYDELSLRIDPGPGGGYHVTASAPGGAKAGGSFSRPISAAELEQFVHDLTRSVRGYSSPELDQAKKLGTALFHSLLDGKVGQVYERARGATDSEHRGLRISLSMTDAPELLELPWELLYDPDRRLFLAQSIFSPVVRSLDHPYPAPPPPADFPLRVLGVACSPRNFPQLDVRLERAKLEKALCPMIREGRARLEWLDTATFGELERRIGAPDELHVIHYVGHGAYDERTSGGILLFEDESGAPREVTGEELGACMSDERSLRLVVLNSCEGTRSSHVDPFSGVAQSLLACGLPAVVGMQAEITDRAAVTFADRLYTALAQGYPIDAALSNARKAIFTSARNVEFGTPVLFMNVPDGRIFELSTASKPTPVEPLKLSLRAEPASVASGGRVSWHLKVRNADCAALSGVTARDRAGETRLGPVDLPVGGATEEIWSTTVNGSGGDECVTVAGRNSEDADVDELVRASVEVRRRRWRPPSGPVAAVGGAALAVLLIGLAIVLLGGGDDGGDGGPAPPSGRDVRVFTVGAGIPDVDVRADKVAFYALDDAGATDIQRLDVDRWEDVPVAPAVPKRYGMDVGLTADRRTQLVYTTCQTPSTCDIFRKSFSGAELRLAVSTPECSESRPAMWLGLVVFDRRGAGCGAQLMLGRANGATAEPITGNTGGADINDGVIVWLDSNGALVSSIVDPDGSVRKTGKLAPAAGDQLLTPIVVEGDHVYFGHAQGSAVYIARTELPLKDDAAIEHYKPGDEVPEAEEKPHFGVTGETLYVSNYPQPNGESGFGKIQRVREPEFVPAE